MDTIRGLRGQGYVVMDTDLQKLRDNVEKEDYEDILSCRKAFRRRVYMIKVKDSENEKMPLFMAKLKNGDVVTCYDPAIIKEEIVYLFREDQQDYE